MTHTDKLLKDRAIAVMGIPPGTDESGLKYAYYRLMFQYHPDRNPSKEYAHEMTSLISEAFQERISNLFFCMILILFPRLQGNRQKR
ncbi:J domain-containing protein [Desulforegula conservatrix]|uniref:J domain-containing protein n=1 Tax=Desulforegula conservatrix TaxID=153026 RepID=UPI0004823E2D|nr:J domain-containing protein [Desulforegula conservatrix]